MALVEQGEVLVSTIFPMAALVRQTRPNNLNSFTSYFFKVPALEVGEVGVEVMALVEVEEAEVLGVVEEVEGLDVAAVALLVVVTLEEVDMTNLMMGTPLRSMSLK